MTTREVNHGDFLRLLNYGVRQWLLHSGTGERVSLAPGQWSIEIGEDEFAGVAALCCEVPERTPEVYWANNLLKLSLHIVERDGVEVNRVIQQEGQGHRELASVAFDVLPKLLQLGEVRANTLDVEIYWHALVYGDCKAFWGLQRLVHFIFPRESYLQRSFITRKIDPWTRRVHALGLETSTHVRPSRQGWESANTKSYAGRYNEPAESEQEWSMSTITMLGWLVGLMWSAGHPSAVIGAGTSESRPLVLIDTLCSRMLGVNEYEVACAEPSFRTTLGATSVDIAGLQASLPASLRQDFIRMHLAGPLSVGELLSRLCCVLTCEKHNRGVKNRLRAFLAAFIHQVGALLDILLEAHLTSDFTGMAVESGRTGKRALRTSQSYKTGMSALARRKVNKRGFLQGFGFSTEKRRKLVSGAPEYVIHERASQKQDKERLYGYLSAQRQRGSISTVSLAFDGVKSIGRECVSGLLQWPESDVGAWTPVQASLQAECKCNYCGE
eukprot:6471286-Amphidinium_carterae.1